MSNLDVAVSSFWQLARHWKSGQKAKLELTCEDGSLNLQLSAVLGHPDHVSFPTPSFPPPQFSFKRKSPSQLGRKERRRDERLRADEMAASDKEGTSEQSENKMIIPKDSLEITANDKTKKAVEKQA